MKIQQNQKKSVKNVLSLFDGISCGRVALERAGIKVDKYYASEIDKYAIQIAQKNYPDTIQVGDITKLRGEDFKDIDMIIGGSPCQGFSFAGKRLNFEDPRSKLFFEYVRILKDIRKYNPDVKFLLENVKMKKEYQDIISEQLGVKPILINSALVSAQNRKRLYWTNIGEIKPPEDRGILLRDILEKEVDEKYYLKQEQIDKYIINKNTTKKEFIQCKMIDNGNRFTFNNTNKSFTITAGGRNNGNNLCIKVGYIGKGGQGQRIYSPDAKSVALSALGGGQGAKTGLYDVGRIRKLTPIECERLQTLPDNYTQGISDTQRYKVLGNGWTVDVIAHIFKGLLDENL